MPIATKRKTEARKSAPIVEAEPEPRPQQEEQPPTPKVTALVFSYDSAPALRRCLAALEGSTDRATIEILVVDCGSHDESPQLDSEFSGVTILRLPRYFGRTKALNIGTRTATGEYLFLLTPEVEVLPTTVPPCWRAWNRIPKPSPCARCCWTPNPNQPSSSSACPTPRTGTRTQRRWRSIRRPTPFRWNMPPSKPSWCGSISSKASTISMSVTANSGPTPSCATRSAGPAARRWFFLR